MRRGGGGGEVTPSGAATAQLNPVAAFAAAQQSVIATGTQPVTAPSAENLVSNGSFENGTTGWIIWGNASVVPGQSSTGMALSVGPAAGGAGQEVGGIVPGKTYRLTAQARVSATSETVYVGVNFIDASGAPFTQNSALVNSTTASTASLDVVAPPNAVRALVYVWKNAGSGVAYVDDFALTTIGVAPPQVASSPNMLANGGFENERIAFANWVNWGNAIEVSPAAGGFNAAQVGRGAGGIGQEVTGIVPGSSYRVSAQTKAGAPGEIGYLGVMFMDDWGTGLRAQNVVFRSSGYAMAQADVTAPAGATKAQVFVWKNAGSGFVYVDEVSLVQLSPAASSSGSPAVLANTTTTASGVAVLKNGTRVAAWSDATGVHSQVFDAGGDLVGGPVSIAPGGTFSGVAALAGGGYVVEYDVPGAVLVQLVSAAGTLGDVPRVVRTEAQVEADLIQLNSPKLAGGTGVYALGNGGFAAEYLTTHSYTGHYDHPGEVFAQRYDAQGNAVEAPKFLAEKNLPPAGYSTVTTVSRPSGGIVVGWNNLSPTPAGGGAWVWVLDDTLNSVAILSSPVYETGEPVWGAELADGTYVAIWTTHDQVRGQVYVPGGGIPPVQTFANVGPGARLTALAGGGFVLTWGTFAQAFNSRGQPVGGVMQILDGSIAATPDGGFVVVAQVGGQLVEQQYAVTN